MYDRGQEKITKDIFYDFYYIVGCGQTEIDSAHEVNGDTTVTKTVSITYSILSRIQNSCRYEGEEK